MNFALLIRYKEYAHEEIPVAIRLQKDGYFFWLVSSDET